MSPSKNLYISATDLPVWEQAEQIAKQSQTSVSKVVVDALRKHLPTRDAYRVLVNGAVSGEITFTDDKRPILDYADHHPHGLGWMLWYPAPGGGSAVEMRFLGPGKPGVPPAGEANTWLASLTTGSGSTVQVEIGDPAVTVEFDGVWLVEPDADETRTAEDGYDAGAYWGIARTGRGRFAVYTAHCNERWPARLDDFDTLDAAAKVAPADILSRAAATMGDTRPIRRDI